MDPNQTNSGQSTPSGGQPFAQEKRELQDIGQQAAGALSGARQRTGEAASAATQSMKETATQVKNQATEVTQKAVSQLKEHGQRAVTEQKERTATTLTDVGNALQNAADRLRQDNDDNIASYIDAVAGLSNRAGSYLREADVSALVGDVQSVARRNPGLFLGGMFIAGLAVARFAKASRPQPRYTGSNYNRPYNPADYYEGETRRYSGPGNHHQAGAYTDPDEYPGARAASHDAMTPQADLIGGGASDVPTSGIGATSIGTGSGIGTGTGSSVGTGTGSGSGSGTDSAIGTGTGYSGVGMSGAGPAKYGSSSLSPDATKVPTPGSGSSSSNSTGGAQ
ncbi:MAG TPA: hypothetical protein VGB55_00685 [Tepidisphaeraceae bacterium]|jgi:gas vesicle protein